MRVPKRDKGSRKQVANSGLEMETGVQIEREERNRQAHRIAFGGLYLFTLLLYARPNEALPELLGDFPLVKIVAVVTLCAYFVSKLSKHEKLSIWPIELKMLALITLLGVLFIPASASPQDSTDLLVDLFLKVVIIFILMINLITTRERLTAMMKLVVVAGTVLGLFAISNYVAGKFTVLDKHVGVRIAGVVGGIFENPNDLATSLDLLIPMAIALALTKRGMARAAYFICATLLATAVVLTFSRGGFLGLVAMCSVLLWKLSRRHRALSALALLLTVGVFLSAMPLGYSSRITSIFDSEADQTGSTQARIDLLERAADVAVGHLVIGVGMGNFHIYSIKEQRAHNSYLEISAELGVAGLIAYLIMIFACLRSLRRVERNNLLNRQQDARRRKPEKDKPNASSTYYLSAALQASLIAYIVCSFFGSIQYLWFLYYPLAYAVSLRQIDAAEAVEDQRADKPVQVEILHNEPVGVLWSSRQTDERVIETGRELR
jgi:O-antigen ligase